MNPVTRYYGNINTGNSFASEVSYQTSVSLFVIWVLDRVVSFASCISRIKVKPSIVYSPIKLEIKVFMLIILRDVLCDALRYFL